MLKVDNLRVSIGKKDIIDGVSFSIKPGEIVGLIGPNGAGKTTIMKAILGLIKIKGEIEFNGELITENKHQALEKVGALIENPAIYPFLTGKQNLQLYSNDTEDLNNIVKILKMESFVDTKAKEYSVGMKQKLGIALALINYPELVILDEPMNGLDIESTILIRKLINEYAAKGTAFLISSHVLSELQKVMTSVIILNQGKVIVDTDMKTFDESNSVYYKLKTNNQKEAEKLLADKKVKLTSKDGYLIISKEDIIGIQKYLYISDIALLELVPVKQSFEQKIVSILQKNEGE